MVSLLQRDVRKALLEGVASKNKSVQLHVMLFTLRQKLKAGMKMQTEARNFAEVIKMIDDMVVLLGKQQDEDDKQKEFCRVEFDKADDEQAAAKTKLEAANAA